MKINKTAAFAARKGFTLVELLVVIAIIAALAGLSYGPIMKQLGAADRTEAISNARSIQTALLGFWSSNDRNFPDDAAGVANTRGITLTAGNDVMQVLVNDGAIDDKKYFWNKSNGRSRTTVDANAPDNSNTLVDQDENVWGYVQGLDGANDGSSVILFDSHDGTDWLTGPWDGKAITVLVDGTVDARQIVFSGLLEDNPTGTITIPGSTTVGILDEDDQALPAGATVVHQ